MNHSDEIIYIKRILNGETNLFSYFLNQYSNAVFSLIVRIIDSKEDAEELTQDTFVKAYKKLNSFKGECTFYTWLFRIAYNTAISATRKTKIIFPVVDESILNRISDDEALSVFEEDDNERLLQQLEIALTKLTVEERALVTLYYDESRPISEITSIMDISTDNVKIKLYRIRKKLFALISTNIRL